MNNIRHEELLLLIQDRPDAAKVITNLVRLDERIRHKGLQIEQLREKLRALPEGAPMQDILDSANFLGDELCRLEDERTKFVENVLHGDKACEE